MKVTTVNGALLKKQSNENLENYNSPNFKSGGGILPAIASMMQWIENQGYLASFMIQDGLGMTAPRVWTGFNRDKEVTGEYNVQEGFEVLGREGLTGPYMIGVAPIVLGVTTRLCRSTNTNTNLIKRYGQSLKDFLKSSKCTNELMANATNFKKEFSKFNLERIYKASVPKDENPEKTLELIYVEFEKLSSKDKKIRNSAMTKINELVNEKILETSPDLYNLNKLYVGEGESKKLFNLQEAIKALDDFAEDAIVRNSNSRNIDEAAAENIKNNLAAKRMLTNIANLAITLGGLSVLPKLYAKSSTPPSMQTLQLLEEQKDKEQNDNSQVAFKGKGPNADNLFAKIGKFLTKYLPEKFNELFEYAGHNFTKTTFAALSLFGLLLPRGIHAWKRAPIDKNTGKKDKTEVNEILLRDTVSSLTVVFAVPILTKIFVNGYENKLGCILTNKASQNKTPFKKFLDVINPYSKLEVLSIAELDAIYGNIDSKAKLMNFANFVNKNGGDLEKILSESENTKVMFNEKTFTLDSIKHLTKKEKNEKIIELFNNFKVDNPKAKNDVITKLMKGSGSAKNNGILQKVRGLNSLPVFISTFVISPILLGVLIPKLTYFNTRKTHEKMAQETLAEK
ncbi:hypothetical protein IKB17_07380 [bacterium]|nr:hypothetical protein [bacterium]